MPPDYYATRAELHEEVGRINVNVEKVNSKIDRAEARRCAMDCRHDHCSRRVDHCGGRRLVADDILMEKDGCWEMGAGASEQFGSDMMLY